MDKGQGTRNTFFTTDAASVLRAIEINADVILKGTRVDGVYDCDPEKNENAIKYESITFHDVIKKNLKIMDSTAFTLSPVSYTNIQANETVLDPV